MTGYNCLIFICISINSVYKADGFLEEENLSGLVATLQLTVQDLQGQIRALSNKTCGKLTFQYYVIKVKRIIPFRPLKYFRETLASFPVTDPKIELFHTIKNTYHKYTQYIHYENMPMQYTEIFLIVKSLKFHKILFFIFLIFAQNIDCGYTLEPPR